MADPVPHLVCPDECTRDDECPLGTVCGTPAGLDSLVCTPPRGPHTPSTALSEGFGVPQMNGTLTTVQLPAADGSVQASAELAWRAPSDATVVTCALFACPPVVEHGRIVNYDECVLARTVSEQVEGSLSLGDAEREHPRATTDSCADGSTPVADTAGRVPVTELLVGCWAYDDTSLVAATRLRRPAAEEIFDFHGTFDLDCRGDDAEGRTCVLFDGVMGTCASAGCHRRCLRDADCGVDGQRGTPGSCDTSMRLGLLSVCAQPEPTRMPTGGA